MTNNVKHLLSLLVITLIFAGIVLMQKRSNDIGEQLVRLQIFQDCLSNGYALYRDEKDVLILECDNSNVTTLTIEEFERRKALNAK